MKIRLSACPVVIFITLGVDADMADLVIIGWAA
jgi:hypothetical protein